MNNLPILFTNSMLVTACFVKIWHKMPHLISAHDILKFPIEKVQKKKSLKHEENNQDILNFCKQFFYFLEINSKLI